VLGRHIQLDLALHFLLRNQRKNRRESSRVYHFHLALADGPAQRHQNGVLFPNLAKQVND